jgi:hypothetical protein
MRYHANIPWRLEMLGGELHIVSGHDPAKIVIKVDDIYGDGSCFPVERQKGNANFIIQAANAFYRMLGALEMIDHIAEAALNKTGLSPALALRAIVDKAFTATKGGA